MLLLVEAGLRVGFALRDRLSAPAVARSPDPGRRLRRGNLAHRALSRARIARGRWQPYVYFRPKPFQGKTITIGADGLRATWQPHRSIGESDAAQKPVKLLMLGGSSLWGFGARDDQTIPSLLARRLHERGVQVELRNLVGARIRQHAGTDRARSRASGGLPAGRGDLLRRGQRHDLGPARRRSRLDDQ